MIFKDSVAFRQFKAIA
ncbi:Putative uncharacterized protein [Lactococcus lactis subsp. lactis A12]|uniref:Uncharacterized protein n=1 Tax=Lactococcus lactis subsp. lactis A12 TaxID=1137134 RepID=S6FSU4_LACLL|nr:Putative uncharacterized protein [Lactococcus lactis subsp. lactis A12]SBW29530.1 Hypothetical protein LLA12_00355 [Lactococcus lactis subsp. lactis]